MTGRRGLLALGLAAAFGVGVFLVMAWGATTVRTETPADAELRAAEVRALFRDPTALLERNEAGALVRRQTARPNAPAELAELHVYAYRAAQQRSYQAEIPFWFFRLKAPAAQFAMNGTGFDLDDLGVTAEDLEQSGEGVVLDELDVGGDRLVIWTRR